MCLEPVADAQLVPHAHAAAHGARERLAGGAVAVRNSRDPHGPALVYTRAEIAAFIAGAKAGEFDDLAG